MSGILINILLFIHVAVCLLLVMIVLMQRPRSEGLGTAFGGAVTDSLFGSSTGNVLTKITTWLGVIFFLTTVSLAYLYTHRQGGGGLGERLQSAGAPTLPVAATNAPPATSLPLVPIPPSPVPAGPEPSKAPSPPAKPITPNGK